MSILAIKTGCRLHFGLMELCKQQEGCYSGLGLMLSNPGFQLDFDLHRHATAELSSTRVTIAESVNAVDAEELIGRIQSVVSNFSSDKEEYLPVSGIHVRESLPLHHGLGAGTQLACAVATGLRLLQKLNSNRPSHENNGIPGNVNFPTNASAWQNERELAIESGRGLRSGIGLTGFLHGGLILDSGIQTKDSVELHAKGGRDVRAESVSLPAEWRVVLLQAEQQKTVAGESEANMLGRIGRNPNPNKNAMQDIARSVMEELNRVASLQRFGRALDEYMQLAGQMFQTLQGGQYSSPAIAEAAGIAKRCGLEGVGQSSWGPIVFGFCDSQSKAESIAESIRSSEFAGKIRIATPTPVSFAADKSPEKSSTKT
ncbi:MAG: hypothetical protein AAF483_19165 [Planctomycetota bacterium]